MSGPLDLRLLFEMFGIAVLVFVALGYRMDLLHYKQSAEYYRSQADHWYRECRRLDNPVAKLARAKRTKR